MTKDYCNAADLERLVHEARSLRPEYMTQQDIADLTGVQRNTVRKWEQNKILPVPDLRLPRWNMPLYPRDETLDALVKAGKIYPEDVDLKKKRDGKK